MVWLFNVIFAIICKLKLIKIYKKENQQYQEVSDVVLRFQCLALLWLKARNIQLPSYLFLMHS